MQEADEQSEGKKKKKKKNQCVERRRRVGALREEGARALVWFSCGGCLVYFVVITYMLGVMTCFNCGAQLVSVQSDL